MMLNPKLWDNFKLKPAVKDKILDIVEFFKDYIEIELNVVDIVIVGSNASFNYTDTSDLDVHLVCDLDSISCNKDILINLLYFSKKSFNDEYDFKIKDIPVELYIEDVTGVTAISSGIYSVLNDKWIKMPNPLMYSNQYDKDYSNDKCFLDWVEKILTACESSDISVIDNTLNSLYMYRKYGIASKGEFSKENLIFKQLRSMGYIDRLQSIRKEVIDKNLSLEGMNFNV